MAAIDRFHDENAHGEGKVRARTIVMRFRVPARWAQAFSGLPYRHFSTSDGIKELRHGQQISDLAIRLRKFVFAFCLVPLLFIDALPAHQGTPGDGVWWNAHIPSLPRWRTSHEAIHPPLDAHFGGLRSEVRIDDLKQPRRTVERWLEWRGGHFFSTTWHMVCDEGFHWHNNENPLHVGSCVEGPIVEEPVVDEKKERGNKNCTAVGNPCNPISGNKFETETDYLSAGPFPIRFERFYNSNRAGVTVAGADWRHSYQRTIQAEPVTSEGAVADVGRASGQILTFTFSNGAWISDPDVQEQLTEVVDTSGVRVGWRLIDAGDILEDYDASGRLLAITSREGFTQTLAYDVDGRLETVTGPFGRTLNFSHDASGRLSTLIDPAGNLYQYVYDTAGNLVSVAYPDDTPGNNADNPTRMYHYENSAFPYHLTGITDENADSGDSIPISLSPTFSLRRFDRLIK